MMKLSLFSEKDREKVRASLPMPNFQEDFKHLKSLRKPYQKAYAFLDDNRAGVERMLRLLPTSEVERRLGLKPNNITNWKIRNAWRLYNAKPSGKP